MNHNCRIKDIDKYEFVLNMERASEIVEDWPKWKRDVWSSKEDLNWE